MEPIVPGEVQATRTKELGTTGIRVTPLCVGTSPLGGMSSIYGYDVDEDRAVATVRRALQSETVRFLDTANEYGAGASERRIRKAIDDVGGLPSGFVVATKADPTAGSDDFSAARIRASFEESSRRLGLGYFDVFHFHDPERVPFDAAAAPGGALEGLRALKQDGLVGALGVAGWDVELLERYLDTGLFDVVLNHNRFTLLNQSAERLMDRTVAAGRGFLNAAPYASGILAKPASANPRFVYTEPSDDIRRRTEQLRALCREYDVDLSTVALQFSTRDPRITSTIVGISHPDRVADLERNASIAVPDELWDRVTSVIEKDSATSDAGG